MSCCSFAAAIMLPVNVTAPTASARAAVIVKNAFGCPLCCQAIMAIKAEDGVDEGNSYLLKAFRELPECFDLIKAKAKDNVIVEEFIEGKPKIEVCCLKGNIRLFSQISLEKSIILKHSWRAFPISLPAKIAKEIKEIIDKVIILNP